jgi:hypothetical protein
MKPFFLWLSPKKAINLYCEKIAIRNMLKINIPIEIKNIFSDLITR